MILNGKLKNDIFHSKSLKKKQSHQILAKKSLLTENIRQNNINLINFIKQKNKFKIHDIFDKENSKKFLDSKNEAMSEIYLNDELELENKNKKEKKENNMRNKYSCSTKLLKTQYINEKTSDTDNKIEIKTNKIDNDSNDSNFIYKFILENANDSEEIFRKKLKKEMKRMDSKKNNEKYFSKFSESKYDKKKKKISGKRQSLFKGQNPFKFSENARIQMINQPIEASSIKSSDYNESQNIIQRKISDEEEKDEINIFNKDKENKNINNSINDFEIDSDKENFMNILSGLAQ